VSLSLIKGVKRPSRRVSSRFGNLLEMCALALPNKQATDLHLQAPPS
jgi:hypothetical protein